MTAKVGQWFDCSFGKKKHFGKKIKKKTLSSSSIHNKQHLHSKNFSNPSTGAERGGRAKGLQVVWVS
jgi:hypothetical protein